MRHRKIFVLLIFNLMCQQLYSQDLWIPMDSVGGPPRANACAFVIGDDGSIVVNSKDLRKVLWQNTQAHAAHVTGLATLINNDQFMSCSVDQRLSQWNLATQKLEQEFFSHVPDIHDMAVWNDGGRNVIAVAGYGLEIFYC